MKALETLLPTKRRSIRSSSPQRKAYLTSAKQLMRRIRDKVPFSQGDRMMINAGGGEMIEGTPQRLLRDYNSLIEASNRLRS